MLEETHMITICNKQTIDGVSEEISLTTVGNYCERGGSRYILYREYDRDGEAPAQISTLKITPDGALTLMRNHTHRTHLVLEQGKRNVCQYGTPFGGMMLGVFADEVTVALNEKGGSVTAHYTLDLDNNLASENEMLITVKEA